MSEIGVRPEIEAADPNFAYYTGLLAGINNMHPQHQGLGEEEFRRAMDNPKVIKSELEVNGERVYIPQLAPITQFEWLNDDFYKNHFTEEFENDNLLHFSDIPEVEPGEAVKERLRQLAQNNGVLVFDFPSADPEFANRLEEFLANLGITVSERTELAKQTYFAGQVTLKRDHELKETPLWLADAYQLAVEDGSYDLSRIENGASLMTTIEEDEARAMNVFYDEAYQVLNDEPCKQGLSPDEFLHMMTEDEKVAKIVNSVDGEIVALVLLENDLTELSWVNAQYYRNHYPEKYEKGQIVWFPGLAANPNKKGGFNTQVMVDLIAELVEKGDNEMLVVFDAGKRNTGFLDVFLNKMINDTPEANIDIKPIASQSYQSVRLSLD